MTYLTSARVQCKRPMACIEPHLVRRDAEGPFVIEVATSSRRAEP